ncbi:unnamed protein product [Kuraishia capsulata CBS 1993]|uniref:Histone-lysine N-methyltransferase, H3 lysine-36 specific n=1 Tax=Kuraishia capsulata CBS 1993 TaxID=1382522 RepID=W6MSF6_9ASCO|nr:uncharacterized protein KUCA_T00005729001 [Kuraishia capsulata CBS 1993]CDK29736.1 unnamed protein product [Kuraishia capsulata CBS 1993]
MVVADSVDEYSSPEKEPFSASDTENDATSREQDSKALKKSASPPPPKLFLNLPDKTEEALATFNLLQLSKYQNAKLGSCGRQTEDMTCDCREDFDTNTKVNHACGEDSECINRLTSVECLDESCSCGSDCQNQRFQKKAYAKVCVIQTEHKGFGLRAEEDLGQDQFIYEYIGEVVDEPSFRNRMIDYDNQGLKHFYFMMLQKGEFIDATKAGCLARFCNHSCSPNAYVDKWVVGKKLRMGIFAKKNILKGEEITFDYNVDRYGAQAQKCYCGEPNCIGFIGGKTQTDSARILPHIIAEALAVTSSQEKEWLKLMKQKGIKRSEKDDDTINAEFVASLEIKTIGFDEVPKITGCLLQPNLDFIVMEKIIDRVVMTEDETVLHRIAKVHGVEAFSTILKNILSAGSDDTTNLDQKRKLSDTEESLVFKVLKLMSAWPKMKYRNRIVNSQVELYLEAIVDRFNDDLTELAQFLLDQWKQLPMEFKIPKRLDGPSSQKEDILADARRSKNHDDSRRIDGKPLPEGWQWAVDANTGNIYFYNREKNLTQWEKPVAEKKPIALPKGPRRLDDEKEKIIEKQRRRDEDRKREKQERDAKLKQEKYKLEQEQEEIKRLTGLADIIAQAKAQQEELARLAAESAKETKHKKSSSQPVDCERLWARALASVVPNMLKKYEKEIGHDNLKLCAKDIVKVLAEKEVKRHGTSKPPVTFDEEKRAKMKSFVKPYMEKFVAKLEQKRQKKRSLSNGNGTSEKQPSKRHKD